MVLLGVTNIYVLRVKKNTKLMVQQQFIIKNWLFYIQENLNTYDF